MLARMVHTSQDVLERKLNVAGIESRRLDEGQVVLACDTSQSLQSVTCSLAL